MANYQQTRQEEKLNVITHGLMAILVLAALPFAALRAYNANPLNATTAAVAVGIFCFCLILMFTASSVYHGLPAESRFKRIFNRFDHMAIYFAIAGSYTPLALIVIGGTAGISLLILEWSLVVIGIIYKSVAFKKSKLTAAFSSILYLLMGWAVVLWLPQFLERASLACVLLIVGGGLLYSGGMAFYAKQSKNMHVIWHFFVDGGAICHFLAIVFFINK